MKRSVLLAEISLSFLIYSIFCHISFIRKYAMYSSFWSKILCRVHFLNFWNTKIRRKDVNFWNEKKVLGVQPFCNLLFSLPCWYIWIILGVVWWHVLNFPYSMNKLSNWSNISVVRKCQPIRLKIFYFSILYVKYT